MFHCVKDAWFWLLGWLVYVLPALSNLVLVLLGVLLSLPTLAEKIEKTPKYRTALGVICLIAGLVGFCFDVGQRRSSDQTNRQLLQDTGKALKKTDDLVDKTNDLVTRTSQMVNTFGILMPQISALNAQMADINKKIEAAKGNPQLIAALQAQASATKAQADSLSRTLSLSFAPGIVAEMQYWAQKWDLDDRAIEREERQQKEKAPPNTSPQEIAKLLEPLGKRRSAMNAGHTEQILPLMTNANYIREQLLHGSESTQDDKQNALIFAKVLAGQSINWGQMGQVTRYMDSLVKKFTPATPSNIKAATH
ncbi:MAG TPA: hypothetical protein VJW96_03700 [Terriglobales bacterium]|jgi:hypothetical protein|nr:hypothetical protein [Terriglobales bacterium]